MNLKYKILYTVARLYWFIFRPFSLGVNVMFVRDEQVLLVKHTYRGGWHLPGGGVHRGEDLDTAVHREADEELGATIHDMRMLGMYSNRIDYKNGYIMTVVSQAFEIGQPKDGEIAEFGFFPFDDLPLDTTEGVTNRIAEYRALEKRPFIGKW
jgi:ADP-ribose pyrophosphatase YjhB (NUDIX family)